MKTEFQEIALDGNSFLSMEDFFNEAVEIAREKMKSKPIPCEWYLKYVRGKPGKEKVVFKVCHVRPK